MRIEVPCPPGWRVEAGPDGGRTLIAPGDALQVRLPPVAPAPEDPMAWIDAALAGATVRRSGEQVMRSGWPALVVEADAGDDAVLIVLWRLLDDCAAALVRAPAAIYAARRAELLALLDAATVDWDPPALLTFADIWAGYDPGG